MASLPGVVATLEQSLESIKLFGVQKTGRELGRGPYTVVEELDYHGVRCAGKLPHPLLNQSPNHAQRWLEECRLHSQLVHPNIVQCLGVYRPSSISELVLVMEFLPTTLADCLKANGQFPEEVNYSIFHDVALGFTKDPSSIATQLEIL